MPRDKTICSGLIIMEELKPSAEAVSDNSDLKDPETGSIPARFLDFVKRKLEDVTSPKSSVNIPSSHKSPMKAPATPLTTVITGSQWLRTIIFPLPPKPSPELEQYLSSCDRDVSTGITRRANIILEAIFTSNNLQSASMMDTMWAAHRKLESLKLYYKVLQGMCVAEAQILKLSNLSSLLTNERFHRCMLACSSDLVLVAHKTTTVLFSEIIDKIGITAFDLSKVIESFIRHEETLPRELRRHLNSLEEQLLESLVWEKGSSLYNSLAVARPALSSEINRLGFLAEPMSSLDEISINTDVSCGSYPCTPSVLKVESSSGHPADMQSPKRSRTGYRSGLVERSPFKTPVKDRILSLNKVTPKPLTPALQSVFGSPARPNPGDGGETCAEIVINVFFHKIVKLAAVRIKGMVERLEVSQQTRETVYRLFQQILSQNTSLFFNRHVDQIILCCFYAVAKISQLKLSFSEIVSHYKRQSHYKPQVLQSVFVEWSSAERTLRYGNVNLGIMEFYNKIFIPCTKQLLKELKPVGSPQCTDQISETNKNSNGNCPESPKLSPFPKLPDMSPRRISSTHNVYVSPLRARKIDALISNGSKSYYACIGESTHAFRSPSKDLSAINNRLNGNRKLRGMLNFDDVDGGFGFVSDSIVAQTLSLQNESRTPSSPVPTVQSEKVDS